MHIQLKSALTSIILCLCYSLLTGLFSSFLTSCITCHGSPLAAKLIILKHKSQHIIPCSKPSNGFLPHAEQKSKVLCIISKALHDLKLGSCNSSSHSIHSTLTGLLIFLGPSMHILPSGPCIWCSLRLMNPPKYSYGPILFFISSLLKWHVLYDGVFTSFFTPTSFFETVRTYCKTHMLVCMHTHFSLTRIETPGRGFFFSFLSVFLMLCVFDLK